MDGVTATAAIKASHPAIHVLILTTYDTDADILRALEKGATGFLLKDEREDRLFDAIREAAGGRSPWRRGVASRLVERLRGDADSHVSEREIESSCSSRRDGATGRSPASSTSATRP